MSVPKLTAHKAWSGGGAGFLALLAAPVGIAPHDTYTGIVLISALLSPWTQMPIDAELLQQAVKGLWTAIFGGTLVHQAVYWTPNKLKDLVPLVASVLNARGDGRPTNPIAARTDGDDPAAKPGSASAGGSGAGGSVASIALMLCTGLIAATLLAGCASDGDAAAEKLEAFAPKTAFEEKSPTQQVADKLFTEAVGEEARAVRQCMIAAGLVELLTWRVTDGGDGAYAATAAGQIKKIEAALAGVDPSEENDFFETDMKHVTIELASVLVASTEDRVEGLLKKFGGGPNVEGILQRVGVAAGQVALADGIVRDVRKAVERITAGTRTAEAVKSSCDQRIDRNKRRIDAMLGVLPPAPRSS